jgi:hypothetical protein
MAIFTREFCANIDVVAIAEGAITKKSFTWNSELDTELALILEASSELEDHGWRVGIECPVRGVQRSQRIPVFAIKGTTALVLKPTKDSKKINISGLKMLDLKKEVESILFDLNVKAVVYALVEKFDERKRTTDAYEVWVRK